MKLRWLTVSLSAGAAIKGMPFVALLIYAAVVGPDEFAQVSMLALASAWLMLLASGGMEFATTYEERRRLADRPPISLIPAWYAATPIALCFSVLFVGFALAVGFPIGPWLVMTGCALVVGLIQPALLGRARMRRNEQWLLVYVVAPFTLGLIVRLVALAVGIPVGYNPLWLWVAGDAAQALLLLVLISPRLRHLRLEVPRLRVLREGWATLEKSLPWMGTAGLQSALANVDKFVLYPIVSAELFGLYSLAYQLANIANILASEYNKARLSHWVSQAVEGRTAGFVRESLHFAAAMAVGAIVALGIALFYRDSFPGIIGVCAALLVALTPVALYIPVENRIAILNGRTMPLLWATGVGVVASLVVLFALVTSLGIFAGVIATFVGYAVTTACLVPVARSDRPRSRTLEEELNV